MSNKKQNIKQDQILRSRAEQELEKNQNAMDKLVEEADMKKLLHELQVHQIELKMQNEELRQANETAELALKKYTMFFDFAPMGYFTLNSKGLICDLNFTGAEMLGEKRFSLIDENFRLFVSEESLPVYNQFLEKAFKSNFKVSCNINLGYDNKLLCPVYMEGIVIKEDGMCLLSVINISNFDK